MEIFSESCRTDRIQVCEGRPSRGGKLYRGGWTDRQWGVQGKVGRGGTVSRVEHECSDE